MGVFLDKETIGIYSVAQRIILPLTMIMAAYLTQLWPKLSSTGTNSEYNISVLKQMKKSNILIALGFALYSIIAPLFIPIMFGKVYSSCILLTQILCFRYCLNIIIIPIDTIGYNYQLAKIYSINNFIQMILGSILYVIFLPQISIWAVAIVYYMEFLTTIIFMTIPAMKKVYFNKN